MKPEREKFVWHHCFSWVVALYLLSCNMAFAQVLTTTGGSAVRTTGGNTVTVGVTTYTGPVATATMIPNNVNTTASQAMMTRKAHYMRSSTSTVQFCYPNWYDSAVTSNNFGQELGSGNSIAVQAWIEYPIGTYTQLTFSSLTTATIATATTLCSDSLTISIPKGSLFYSWTHVTGSGGNNFPYYFTTQTGNPLWYNAGGGEKADAGTSGVPTSPGTMSDSDSGRQGYWPAAILGSTTQPTFCLVEDSRGSGVEDTEDSSYDLGNIARSIGPAYAYLNMGVSGDRMAAYWASHALRDALITTSGCTNIIDELGTNEFDQQSATNVQWEAISQNLMSHMVNTFPSIPIFRATMEPWTTSTDNWESPLPASWGVNCGNQTPASFNSTQTTENDHIRSGSFDSIPYVEIANAVTTATDSGCWKANGYSQNYTIGGGHESRVGNQSIVQSQNINPRAISLTAPITYSYPSINLSASSGYTPSYTTGHFSGTQAVVTQSDKYLTALGIVPGVSPMTLECWVQTSSTSFGQPAQAGTVLQLANSTGYAGIKTGNGTQTNSTLAVNDGNFHDWELDMYPPSVGSNIDYELYIDGTNEINYNYSTSSLQWENQNGFQIGSSTSSAIMNISECSLWNYARHTSGFTPPTNPYVGTESGLVALWHLNGNLNGIRGPAGM
jgi:hypothetical protein